MEQDSVKKRKVNSTLTHQLKAPPVRLSRKHSDHSQKTSKHRLHDSTKYLTRPLSANIQSFVSDQDDSLCTKIRIRSCHKTLLCASDKGTIEHSINKLEEEYIWMRSDIGGNLFSLKSCNGRYLSSEKGGKLLTSRTRKQFEVFTAEPLPNLEKKFAIKTVHGEFLCALPNGSLQCNRFGPQAWETFEIEEEPFAPSVYGGNLNDIVVYQLKNGLYSQVPQVLEVLADNIRRLDGHNTEGIWRISGDGAAVMKYRSEFQKGNYDFKIDNCHDAATLFKLFLRELSEPVFPDNYYPTALQLAEEQKISTIQELIKKLDNINLKVIQFVINFLRSFLKPEYVKKTMMTANNLATVFAPTILRCPSDNPFMQITASTSEVKFVLILIDHLPEELKEDYFSKYTLKGN